MEAYLQTEDLAVGYQGRTLIGEISLAVQRGRIVTLIGPNGSGKSTILKTIAGQLPRIGGAAYLDGEVRNLEMLSSATCTRITPTREVVI